MIARTGSVPDERVRPAVLLGIELRGGRGLVYDVSLSEADDRGIDQHRLTLGDVECRHDPDDW